MDTDRATLLKAVEDHGSVTKAAAALGMSRTTFRRRIGAPGGETPVYIRQVSETAPPPEFGFVPHESLLGEAYATEAGVATRDFTTDPIASKGVRRYILTSAQNNCRVHDGFLRNLEALAAHLDAQILVSFSVYDRHGYRGVTTKGEQQGKRALWWDKAIEPYIINERARLAPRLAFCGELDVIASAANPLSGLDAYCGRSSVIVPHNKFAFRCVESRKGHLPKELYTTGSITHRKFIARKTGQLAHFHHVIGALLVEVDTDGYFWVHHLNAEENGAFQWLDVRVEDGEIVDSPGVAGLILGDIHTEKCDQWASECHIISQLQPDTVVIHDLIDFTSRNHHTRKDPFFRVEQRDINITGEVAKAARFLHGIREWAPRADVAVVRSNHDEAMDRWVRETDWRDDPTNAEFYLRLALRLVQAATKGEAVDALPWAIEDVCGKLSGTRFLAMDESYEVQGIECGMHGHVGPSGAKGSPRGFSRMGFKSFTGHTHSPSIVDGCYTVGVTGNLDMGYNRGPSKWMRAHGIIYQNGKRAFVFVKNGKWRA